MVIPKINFSWLPLAVSRSLINIFSQNISYDYMMIDTSIIGFSTNEEISSLQICDNTIITFGKRGICLGFSNTSRVDILDSFRKVVI